MMCIQYTAKFKCGHSSNYIDTDHCRTKNCVVPKERTEDRPNEDCFDCIGSEPVTEPYDGPTLYYKHCFQSAICDHEYDHMITDADRPPRDPEVVLVTPMETLCPDCLSAGYDTQLGGANPPPNTRSMMPQEFEDLPRQVENEDGSTSIVPFGMSLRPGGFDGEGANGDAKRMKVIAEEEEGEERESGRSQKPHMMMAQTVLPMFSKMPSMPPPPGGYEASSSRQ